MFKNVTCSGRVAFFFLVSNDAHRTTDLIALKNYMLIRNTLLLILISCLSVKAQVPVNLSGLHKKNGVKAEVKNALLSISWPVEGSERGKIVLDLEKDKPLFKSIQLSRSGAFNLKNRKWVRVELWDNCSQRCVYTTGMAGIGKTEKLIHSSLSSTYK